MRVKHKPGGAEPPINHPRYEKAMNVQYTSDIQRICQYLANSDPDVRHTALTFIPQALEETLLKNSLGSHDAPEQGARPLFSKLWKAFFFVIWHEDGTQEQDTVVHMVGALPLYVPSLLSAAALRRLWFQEAYERFARDWSRIDKWRQDKFLYGVRRLLYVSLRMLPRSCMGEILNKVLLSQLPGEMFSLAVHLVDILLDELCRAPTLPPATILWYLTDVVARVMAQSPEPAMHLRIREWILEPLCAEKLLTEVPENTVLSPKMRKKFKFDKDMNEVSHLLPGLVRDDKENKKNGAALGGGGDTKEALRLVPHRLCDVLDNLILDPETLDRNRRWLQADVKMMRDYLPILNEGSSVGTKKKNKRELKRSTPDRNSVSGESDSPADAKRRRPAVLDMTVRESSKESSSIIVPSPPLLGKLRAVKAPDMYLRPRLKKSSMKQRSTGSPIS